MRRPSLALARMIPILVSLVTAAVYARVLWSRFVDWDDVTLLVRNAA
jgi:hypothetical protein